MDAGCGNGIYIRELKDDFDIHGIDYVADAAWSENSDRFSVCDVVDINKPNESFDTVAAFEVLEHVPQPERALREFHRVARNHVILTVPNCDLPTGMQSTGLTFYHYTDRTHVNFFTLKSFTELCESEGFRIVESRLINQVNLSPLLAEAYGLPKIAMRAMNKFMRRRQFLMTCLVVAEKVDAQAPAPKVSES